MEKAQTHLLFTWFIFSRSFKCLKKWHFHGVLWFWTCSTFFLFLPKYINCVFICTTSPPLWWVQARALISPLHSAVRSYAFQQSIPCPCSMCWEHSFGTVIPLLKAISEAPRTDCHWDRFSLRSWQWVTVLLARGSYFWHCVFGSAGFLQLQVHHCLMDKQTTSLLLSLRSEIETLWGDTTLWIWPRSSSLVPSPFRAVSLL